MRDPDVGLVRREDVREVSFALDAARRELGDVDVAGPLVAMLDEQPAPPVARAISAARPYEDPRAFQLVAVQRELEVPLLQRGVDALALRGPGADVAQHDDPRAVAFRDDPLERAVLDRVILDLHGQALRLRVERRTLRDGPGQQDTLVLEPEVVVEVARE